MIVYVCDCGCFHGWKEDPARIVKLVTKHSRGAMEDIWRCPRCDREHRTHDGTALGQVHKAWRDATPEEIADIERGETPGARRLGMHSTDGMVYFTDVRG